MATLIKKRELATLNKKNCGEHPRSNLAQNTNLPRSQKEDITQISEEIEGRVTKKLSKKLSRTESRILDALFRLRLDEFLLNPLFFRVTPDPLRRYPGTHLAQTRERMRTTARVILILKRASLRVRLHKFLPQTIAMTLRQILAEYSGKFLKNEIT